MSHQKSPNTEKCPLKDFLEELGRVESWREETTWKEAVQYEKEIIEACSERGVLDEEGKRRLVQQSRDALTKFLIKS